MKRNVSTLDRGLRAVGSAASTAGAMLGALPWEARGALGITAVYLLFTALWGTCLGYRMLGLSSCPAEQQ